MLIICENICACNKIRNVIIKNRYFEINICRNHDNFVMQYIDHQCDGLLRLN